MTKKYTYKFILSLLVLLFLLQTTQAQFAKWIQMDKKDQRLYQMSIVGHDASGFYAFAEGYKTYSIRKYNFNFDLNWSRPIILDDRGLVIEKVLTEKGSSAIFYSVYVTSTRTHSLKLLVIDHLIGEVIKEQTILTVSDIAWKNKSDFTVLVNKQRDAMCAVHRKQLNSGKYELKATFLSENYENINEASLVMNKKDVAYQITDHQIDDYGNYFLLVESSDLEKKKSDLNYKSYELFKLNPINTSYESFNFDSPTVYLNDLSIKIDQKNNQLVACGLYSNQNRYEQAGVFTAKLSPENLNLIEQTLQSFSKDLMVKIIGNREVEKDKGLKHFSINEIVFRSDGGFILLAESFFITRQISIRQSVYAPVEREIEFFHYNEVIVCSVNPDGSFEYQEIIPKSQVVQANEGLGSFSLMLLPDRISVIFNEDLSRNSNLQEFSVSNKGLLKPNRLIGVDTENLFLYNGGGKQISQRTFMIPALRRKKKGFLQITY